jgi:hypothetical protein
VWQAAASIAALVTAVAGAGVGVAGFVRSARAEDAKGRADAAGVGLEYLERALATQQAEIIRQEGEIGELRGQLKECREERAGLAVRLAELEGKVT